MNSLILNENEKIDEKVYLIDDPERANHIYSHIKKRENDHLRLNMINQGISTGKILQITTTQIKIEVLEKPLFNPLRRELIIGLVRPQSTKKILEYCSSLGIKKITFYQAQLSEKSYGSAKVFLNKNYEKHLLNGLSQSARYSQMPLIELVKKLDWARLPKNKYLLSLNSTKKINEIPLKKLEDACFAIGPERGWSDQEENIFSSQGFEGLSISKSILRTELAALITLGQIEGLTL